MKIIETDGKVLAKLIPVSQCTEGLSFFSQDDEPLQAGTWNCQAGTKLPAHIHNEAHRIIKRTNEVLYIYSGGVMASIYDEEENLIEELQLQEGDVLILLAGGHGYRILDNAAKVLEKEPSAAALEKVSLNTDLIT